MFFLRKQMRPFTTLSQGYSKFQHKKLSNEIALCESKQNKTRLTCELFEPSRQQSGNHVEGGFTFSIYYERGGQNPLTIKRSFTLSVAEASQLLYGIEARKEVSFQRLPSEEGDNVINRLNVTPPAYGKEAQFVHVTYSPANDIPEPELIVRAHRSRTFFLLKTLLKRSIPIMCGLNMSHQPLLTHYAKREHKR